MKNTLLITLLILVLIILSGFKCQPGLKKDQEEVPAEENSELPEFLTPTNQQAEVNNLEPIETPTANVDDTEIIKQTAEKFVARFGTYTTKDDFKNVENLKTYMTDSLKIKMDDFVKIERAKQKANQQQFFGVTTTTMMSKILESTNTEATVLVDTKREEITSKSKKPEVYYQNAVVKLKKIDEDWKIDDLQWSK